MKAWRLPWLIVIVVWLECGLYWPHLPVYISDPVWPGMLLWRRHFAIIFPGLVATLIVTCFGLVQELLTTSGRPRNIISAIAWLAGILGLGIGIRSWLFFSDHLAHGHRLPLDFHTLALMASVVVMIWALDLITLPSENLGPALAIFSAALFFVDYVWHGIDSFGLASFSLVAMGFMRRYLFKHRIPQAPEANH